MPLFISCPSLDVYRLLIEVHGTCYFPGLRGEAMNGAKSILTSHRNNFVNEESHAGAIRAASIVA